MKVKYDAQFLLSKVNENDREFQPRLEYDQATIDLLAKDIERNGQHNPIGIRDKGQYYQVIYGYQRVIAIKSLGREVVKANIYEEATDAELHAQSISNNERHSDLDDYERALYVSKLKASGISVGDLCEMFGLNKSVIYNLLAVSELDDCTRDCLRLKRISLNHAVELARIDDYSKRLETLTFALSSSWSIRELKQWIAGGEGRGKVGILGHIELCPKHLCHVSVAKPDTVDEMKAKGLGDLAVKQQLELSKDSPNCEQCDHFYGLTEDWFVQCSYDLDALPSGIKELVNNTRLEHMVDNAYPLLEKSRDKHWSHLVKPRTENTSLIPMAHLKVGFWGYTSEEMGAITEDVDKANTFMSGLAERFRKAESLEDKTLAFSEFTTIARYAGKIQNAWAEKNVRSQREIGHILSEVREKHGPRIYKLFNAALRCDSEQAWEAIITNCNDIITEKEAVPA